jgi:predicted ribosomally synthesized peptide with SipW-like signal peptide
MTKTNSKKALLSSAFALVVSVAMLIGTTFAWFTDTASTGVNKIVSGNLKVDIIGENSDSHIEKLNFTKAATTDAEAGAEILWEPGCRYLTEGFRIANKGNLALKWKAQVNKGTTAANEGNFDLLDVIDFYLVTKAADGTETATALDEFTGNLKKTETSGVYYIKGVMQTTAGNDYQGLTLDGITVTVIATQDTVENDSFGDQYDKDAPLDFEPVATADELKAAAADGKNILLTQDVALTNAVTFDRAVTIDLNGKTLTTALNSNGYSLVTKANATIINGTYKATGTSRGIGAYGNLKMSHVTVDVAGLVGVACSADNGQYIIEDSTIKGGYALCNFNNNVKINVSDSTLEGKTIGLYHNGSNFGLDLTVTGTKINAGNNGTDATGVYISGSTSTRDAGGYQKASFTDCTIKGNAAVEVKYTDLTLNNCTAIATVDVANASYVQNNNGSTTNGFAVVSTDNATNNTMPKPEGTITIKGGSYTGLIGLHSLAKIVQDFPGFVDTTYVINQ